MVALANALLAFVLEQVNIFVVVWRTLFQTDKIVKQLREAPASIYTFFLNALLFNIAVSYLLVSLVPAHVRNQVISGFFFPPEMPAASILEACALTLLNILAFSLFAVLVKVLTRAGRSGAFRFSHALVYAALISGMSAVVNTFNHLFYAGCAFAPKLSSTKPLAILILIAIWFPYLTIFKKFTGVRRRITLLCFVADFFLLLTLAFGLIAAVLVYDSEHGNVIAPMLDRWMAQRTAGQPL